MKRRKHEDGFWNPPPACTRRARRSPSLPTPTLVPRKKTLLGSRDLVVVFIVFPGFYFFSFIKVNGWSTDWFFYIRERERETENDHNGSFFICILCIVVVDLLLKSSDKVVVAVVVNWRVSCAHKHTPSLPPSLPPSHTDRQTDRQILENHLWGGAADPQARKFAFALLGLSAAADWVGFSIPASLFWVLADSHTVCSPPTHPPTRPHTHTCSYSFDSVLENHREKDRQTDRQTEKGMGITGVLDSGQQRLQELGYKQELQRDLSYVGASFLNTPKTKLDLLLPISKSQQPLQLQS